MTRRPPKSTRMDTLATYSTLFRSLSGRVDELDLLASIVNSMLAELEHSMSEVKGVCDNIAHDLRTPLTRLRAQLYRLQQHAPTGAERDVLIEQIGRAHV